MLPILVGFRRVHPLEPSLHLHLLGLRKSRRKKEGKVKDHVAAAKGKGKAIVVAKGKCFYCNVDGHWERNCPEYFAEKKKENDCKYG